MTNPTPAGTPVGHKGTAVDITEHKAWSGGGGMTLLTFLVSVSIIALGITLIVFMGNGLDANNISPAIGVPLIILAALIIVAGALGLVMVRVINPGETRVIQFFGRYIGTIRRTGICVIPPLSSANKVSIKVRNFETNTIKVNDLNGNPVTIGAIVVWQVSDTAKSIFAVEDVEEFIHSQAESALRHVATTHPYDSTDITSIPSLSGSTDIVSAELAEEVAARAAIAGLEIIETRISTLAYAPEIAQSMLQRQQASAIVDARETIVDGAVSMVESALDQLDERDIVDLDPERRASMVSNLLVVLCSDNNTQPVINTGSLYT